MDPILLSIICLSGMIILMLLRVPIAVSLGVTSFLGLCALRGFDTALRILGSSPFEFSASWTLSAIPMFLLMAGIVFRCGLTESLFDAARLWLARLPGGLALATNFACAMFAAASGSSLATAAAVGRIAVPEMLRMRYDPALATASVAAAGTLGAMIPPSIAFVVFGWYTETPIGLLLIAGIIPGLLNAILFAAYIIGYCKWKPPAKVEDEKVWTFQEKLEVSIKVWPIPTLVLLIIGGIYSGLTTVTEAAAFGAFTALVIAGLRGGLTVKALTASVIDALNSTASIFLIAVSAVLLTRFLAIAGLPQYLNQLVFHYELGPYSVIMFMVVLYIILGCFLDSIGAMLITLPILLPMWETAGLDMIWMGVLVVMLLEVGLMTPPVGLNAFVVKSVVGDTVPITTIFRGLIWFVAIDFVLLALLIVFPQISLFLPSLAG